MASSLRAGAALDRRGALVIHRAAGHPTLCALLLLCTRLADGPLWVALLLVLPWLGGPQGEHGAWQMMGLGSTNLAIYGIVKHATRRVRPHEACPGITACARVPDAFSFPSGHTLHAFAFGLLLSATYPALAPLLWAFALLVAASRVVLGLHYPGDVLAGAAIGLVTAGLTLLAP